MKKIVISLAIIGVVAGITLGITGAFWTDEGVSENQSFKAGTFELKLANSDTSGNPTGGWLNDVTDTWKYENLAPGGESVGTSLWLKNEGSIDADWLKFDSVTYPDPTTMNETMRITKLAYAGKSLLTGGAGTDVAPTDCDIKVGHRNSEENPGYWFDGLADWWNIQEAIDAAKDGDTICVAAGIYDEAVPIGKQLTLLGAQYGVDPTVAGVRTDDDAESIINGGINIGADNVTIDGFKVTSNEGDGIIIGTSNHTIKNNYIVSNKANGINFGVDTHGTTVKNNYIALNGKSGIESGKRAHDITIENNHITLNEVNGILLKSRNHDIRIEKNTITLNVRRGIWLFEWGNNNPIHHNNIYGNTEYGIEAFWPDGTEVEFTEVDATNNWWGNFDPSDQVSSNVDWYPYAGGPFIGFINGNDQNGNGFADLEDLHFETIVVENPQLAPGAHHSFKLYVQLDGPTSTNDHQGGTVGLDVTVTMGQGPSPAE